MWHNLSVLPHNLRPLNEEPFHLFHNPLFSRLSHQVLFLPFLTVALGDSNNGDTTDLDEGASLRGVGEAA